MIAIRTIPRRRTYFAPGTFSKLREVYKAGPAASGPCAAALEHDIGEALGLSNPVAVTSGRTGLFLLLKTSGLEPGSEILMPGYTFGMVYPAVRAAGFTPVAVDIDPETFQMAPDAAEAAVSPSTGAVLATHLFGEPCDMDRIMDLARCRGLLVIEDCAQALGAKRRDARIGTLGNVGFSSFDKSKPLQGIRGGVIFGRDTEWLKRAREKVIAGGAPADNPLKEIAAAYLEHFLLQSPAWRIPMILFSSRAVQRIMVAAYRSGEDAKTPSDSSAETAMALQDIKARMVSLNLESLEERLARRRAIRSLYHELLGGVLEFQRIHPEDEGSVHLLTAKASGDVFSLRRYLSIRGIDIGIGNEIADDCLDREDPAIKRIFNSVISLPIYSALKDSDICYIADTMKKWFEKARR